MVSFGRNVGQFSPETTFITELYSFGDFATENDITKIIYHGITNFLNIGDLTTVTHSGDTNYIEIKSGKGGRGESWKNRLERQKERAANMVKIAMEKEGYSSNTKTKIKRLDRKPDTIINKLGDLLERVKNKDFIAQTFSSYLNIAVINHGQVADLESIRNKVENIKKQLKYSEKDSTITLTSHDLILFSPNKAPWSIFPFHPEVIANILLQKYYLIFYFNFSQFARVLQKKGWETVKLFNLEDQTISPFMMVIGKDRIRIAIPPLLISRIIFEGLSVDSLIAIFEDMKKEGPSEEYMPFYDFEKEKYLWD